MTHSRAAERGGDTDDWPSAPVDGDGERADAERDAAAVDQARRYVAASNRRGRAKAAAADGGARTGLACPPFLLLGRGAVGMRWRALLASEGELVRYYRPARAPRPTRIGARR